jgi:two-component system sensor histidine kinase DesK
MQISRGQRTRAKAPRAAFPDGRRPSDEMIASSGVTFHLWRLYQHAWLVCLVFPLVRPGQ